MADQEFLQLIQEQIRVYREIPLPVLLCDKGLRVYWSNHAAALRCGHLTGENDLQGLLSEFDPPALFTAMEERGSCTVEHAIPLTGSMITMTPLRDGDAVIGAAVMIIGGDSAVPAMGGPRVSGRTALALSTDVRENVDGIFAAMDTVYMKALMVDCGSWLAPHLNQISVGVYRILRTTTNIAEYAKLQGGALALRYAPVNLFRRLRELGGAVTELCEAMEIPVTFSIPEEDAILQLDLERTEQAFFNVLYNSLTYTRPGNHIVVGAAREGGRINLWIEDHGAGIKEALLTAVFLPYRSHPPQGGHGGIGLGLTLARRLVEEQGGVLTLESVAGEGTKVTFSFPDRSFNQELAFAQNDHPPLTGRYSPLYIGLVGILDKPFGKEGAK